MSASANIELSPFGVAIEARLAELGIVLPAPGLAHGSYVPWVISGKQVLIAGQGPRLDGQMMYAGQVGVDLGVDEGRQAARLCALNLIAQLKAACGGDLGRVVRVVRLAGVAAINCVGGLGGFVSPYIVGLVKDMTGSTDNGVYFIAGFAVIGALITLSLPKQLVNR